MTYSANRTWTHRVFAAAGLAVCLATTGAAIAQSEKPKSVPPADQAPLGGPQVHEREVPGVNGAFGNSPEATRRKFADRIPPRVMREALGAVMREDAPDDIRATDEQREKIQDIQRDFEQQLRAYAQEHRKELEDIRDKLPGGGPAADLLRRLDGGKGNANGERPQRRRAPDAGGTPDEMSAERKPERDGKDAKGDGGGGFKREEASPELREQVRAVMEGMPQFEETYTKIWQELSPRQRETVDARLQEYRDRQAQQREEAYVRQRVGKKEGDDKKPDSMREGEGLDGPRTRTPLPPRRRAVDGARLGPDGAQMPPPAAPRERAASGERHERLMRMWERLSPEQQDQLLERLEARMSEMSGATPAAPNRGRSARPERGQPKPPPPIDDMKVPPPEEMDGQGAPSSEPTPRP